MTQVGEELQSGQYLLNTLMDSIADSIYFKDLESRFVKVSRSFADKHSIGSAEEAIGKTDFDYFKIDHARKAYSDEQHIIQTGETLGPVEEKETWSDGHVTWASTIKMPLKDTQGNIIGTFGISRDITEGKQAEQSLKKNEKQLRELNATKDKLLRIISHDLKNLFNSILGFSRMLKDTNPNEDAEQIKRFAQIIHQSASDSHDLLQNLLQWSSIQTGQMKFNPQSIKVYDKVHETLSMLEPNIDEKDITVQIHVPSDLYAFADEFMLGTILRNLVLNAIKFTPEGGYIEVKGEKDPDKVLISVKDTGIGIDRENQEKLFRMEQAYMTKGTNNEQGTGLGLILCKDLTEKHGGIIYVDSEVNKGSTFTFTLPVG